MTIELDAVNEKSSFKIPFTFYDEDNLEQEPETLHYRIDCVTTGQNIKSLTEITPGINNVLTITTLQNAIIDNGNATETKRLTLIATWGETEGMTEQIDWEVNNLSYLA